MTHYWRAEVTVTGVHAITEAEFELMHSVIHGVLRHDASTGELNLVWRFPNGSPDIDDAMKQASAAWREAVEHADNAADPVCTDYRVHRVEGL